MGSQNFSWRDYRYSFHLRQRPMWFAMLFYAPFGIVAGETTLPEVASSQRSKFSGSLTRWVMYGRVRRRPARGRRWKSVTVKE